MTEWEGATNASAREVKSERELGAKVILQCARDLVTRAPEARVQRMVAADTGTLFPSSKRKAEPKARATHLARLRTDAAKARVKMGAAKDRGAYTRAKSEHKKVQKLVGVVHKIAAKEDAKGVKISRDLRTAGRAYAQRHERFRSTIKVWGAWTGL